MKLVCSLAVLGCLLGGTLAKMKNHHHRHHNLGKSHMVTNYKSESDVKWTTVSIPSGNSSGGVFDVEVWAKDDHHVVEMELNNWSLSSVTECIELFLDGDTAREHQGQRYPPDMQACGSDRKLVRASPFYTIGQKLVVRLIAPPGTLGVGLSFRSTDQVVNEQLPWREAWISGAHRARLPAALGLGLALGALYTLRAPHF